jgi:hypothetical protein
VEEVIEVDGTAQNLDFVAHNRNPEAALFVEQRSQVVGLIGCTVRTTHYQFLRVERHFPWVEEMIEVVGTAQNLDFVVAHNRTPEAALFVGQRSQVVGLTVGTVHTTHYHFLHVV